VYTSIVLFLCVLPPCCLCSLRQTVFFIFIPTQDADWKSRLVTLGSRAVPILGMVWWFLYGRESSWYFFQLTPLRVQPLLAIAFGGFCALHLLGGGSDLGF